MVKEKRLRHLPIPAAADQGYRPAVYIDEGTVPVGALRAALERVVRSAEATNRYLIRVRSAETLAMLDASTLVERGIHLIVDETIVGTGAVRPGVIKFPSETTTGDVEDYGLAFSDAVVADDTPPTPLGDRAKSLGKKLVALQDLSRPIVLRASDIETAASRTLRWFRYLDPDAGLRFSAALKQSGRINVVMIESMAFLGKALCWRFGKRSGHSRTLRHLSAAAGGLRPGLWAPVSWHNLPPPGVMSDHPTVIQAFGQMERAASAGAGLYRDLIWLVHSATFLAVFAAVADVVWRRREFPNPEHHGAFTYWPCVELLCLVVIVGLVFVAHRLRLQHLWTACRIGAEQLRLARMSLPLLIVPPLLLKPDFGSEGEPSGKTSRRKGVEEAAVSIALVKRAVRSCGPIGSGQIASVPEAAERLRAIVQAQYGYHADNHEKLEALEILVRSVNYVVFALVIVVVVSHLTHTWYPHLHWLDPWWSLLVTASGPAFAGALHGATARLEVARRGDLSRTYAQSLATLDKELAKVIADPEQHGWVAIRSLARRATEAMGGEAGAWHATMLVEPVTLPS